MLGMKLNEGKYLCLKKKNFGTNKTGRILIDINEFYDRLFWFSFSAEVN